MQDEPSTKLSYSDLVMIHLLPVPLAIVDEPSKSVFFVLTYQEQLPAFVGARLVPAPGVATHPLEIKIGDVIGWDVVGWVKLTVRSIVTESDAYLDRSYHRTGCVSFNFGHFNVRYDGRKSIDTIYRFPAVTP